MSLVVDVGIQPQEGVDKVDGLDEHARPIDRVQTHEIVIGGENGVVETTLDRQIQVV